MSLINWSLIKKSLTTKLATKKLQQQKRHFEKKRKKTKSGRTSLFAISPSFSEFWLLKSAQQVLGAVLCCPGCFSLYRGTALRQVVATYSSEVKQPFDTFLKDMGEDRWLCTLMMLKGWVIVWKKVEETKSLRSFWVLQRKTDFPLFYEALEKVGAFWGQNETTHEINS